MLNMLSWNPSICCGYALSSLDSSHSQLFQNKSHVDHGIRKKETRRAKIIREEAVSPNRYTAPSYPPKSPLPERGSGPIQYIVPYAHSTHHPKQYLVRVCCFCTIIHGCYHWTDGPTDRPNTELDPHQQAAYAISYYKGLELKFKKILEPWKTQNGILPFDQFRALMITAFGATITLRRAGFTEYSDVG